MTQYYTILAPDGRLLHKLGATCISGNLQYCLVNRAINRYNFKMIQLFNLFTDQV